MPSFDPYPLQPMTLLDAVNLCLRAIGNKGVLALDSESMTPDAELALKSIHDWSIQLQSKGWTFNTERAVTLNPFPHDHPTDAGKIAIPANCLKCDTIGYDRDFKVVIRGRFLYYPEASTFDIGQFRTELLVRMVVALDYEDLPQAARNYIAAQASLTFGTGRIANAQLSEFLRQQAIQALLDLQEDEDLQDDETLYDKNPHLYRMHRRRRYV